jgi:hypothetical protein
VFLFSLNFAGQGKRITQIQAQHGLPAIPAARYTLMGLRNKSRASSCLKSSLRPTASAVSVWNIWLGGMVSAPVELLTQHVTPARQTLYPTIPDDITWCQTFRWMCGEILLARQLQARGLTRKSRPDNPCGQQEHVGLALILGRWRGFPCNKGTPRQQR